MVLTDIFNHPSLLKPLVSDVLSGPRRFNNDVTQAVGSYFMTKRELTQYNKVDRFLDRAGATLLQGHGIVLCAVLGAGIAARLGAPSVGQAVAAVAGIAAMSPLVTKAEVAAFKYFHKGLSSVFNKIDMKLGIADKTAEQPVWPTVEAYPRFNAARAALNH